MLTELNFHLTVTTVAHGVAVTRVVAAALAAQTVQGNRVVRAKAVAREAAVAQEVVPRSRAAFQGGAVDLVEAESPEDAASPEIAAIHGRAVPLASALSQKEAASFDKAALDRMYWMSTTSLSATIHCNACLGRLRLCSPLSY